jgi:hypothetical protein
MAKRGDITSIAGVFGGPGLTSFTTIISDSCLEDSYKMLGILRIQALEFETGLMEQVTSG